MHGSRVRELLGDLTFVAGRAGVALAQDQKAWHSRSIWLSTWL
jgi:hypothetical protein